MESRKKTLKKKALKNKKENMQESNIYTIMHCRLARLYLSGNDVLSLPDDTEILVNVCRIYTQLADSTSALYAMEKDRQNVKHAKYVNSYICCKKVLDRTEEQNQAERMFIKITAKEAKQCFCNIKNLPANSFRRKEKK